MSIHFKKDAEKPLLYPKVVRKDPTIEDPGFVEVDGYRLRHNVDLMPQRGMQENLCASECNLIFLGGSGTSGKMQPYDAKILTPRGFVTMGSLRVGDVISDTNGGKQTVEQIYEHGLQDVYKVVFSDGTRTECGLEHLWKVRTRTAKTGFGDFCVMTLEDIIKRKNNGETIAIPLCSPVEFDNKEELPIPPYTLGALIGNGCFTCTQLVRLTTTDPYLIENIKKDGVPIHGIKSDPNEQVVGCAGFYKTLDSLGLLGHKSETKFIPEIYKKSSVKNRIALMQGLMDTDGFVGKRGNLQYYTVSEKLAKDVQEIVLSLGGRCSITIKEKPTYRHNGEIRHGKDCYTLHINTSINKDLVTTPHKLSRVRGRFYKDSLLGKNIASITQLPEQKMCRCIRVSNTNRLYITDDYIVTHNTFGALLASMKGLGYRNYTARIVTMQSKDNEIGTSMKRDAEQVFGGFANCNFTTSGGLTAEWPQWNNSIKFIHANFNIANPNEWDLYKQHCKANTAIFFYWDEVTGVKEWKKFAYMFSRNRDSSGAMRPKTIVSFNPENKHWTTKFLQRAGYLDDDWYLKENMNGVVKYFYSGDGDSVEDIVFGDTRKEVAKKAGLEVSAQEAAFGMSAEDMVKSFTIYMGSPVDNKILANITKGESIANLAAVGKTEGAKMHKSYFGPDKNEENKVTRAILEGIFDAPRSGYDEEIFASLDISAGGDGAPMYIWRGNTIIGREEIDGKDPVELKTKIRAALNKWNVPAKNFAFDGGGMGFFLKEFKDGRAVINNMRPIQEIDSYGNPTETHKEYYDLRSQLLAKLEAMLVMGEISSEISPIATVRYTKTRRLGSFLDVLDEERSVFAWEDRSDYNGKLKAVTKKVFKSKMGYSPDDMDSIMIKMIFNLDARPRKEETTEFTEADYYAGFNGF